MTTASCPLHGPARRAWLRLLYNHPLGSGREWSDTPLSLLWGEQAQPPQPLLLHLVYHHHLSGLRLACPQFAQVVLELGSPKLGTTCQIYSCRCWPEGKNLLPFPSGYISSRSPASLLQGHFSGPCSTCSLPGPSDPFVQSSFLDCPQAVVVHGLIPPKVWGSVLVLYEASVNPCPSACQDPSEGQPYPTLHWLLPLVWCHSWTLLVTFCSVPSAKLLVKVFKNICPRTVDPWGTPLVITIHPDFKLLTSSLQTWQLSWQAEFFHLDQLQGCYGPLCQKSC